MRSKKSSSGITRSASRIAAVSRWLRLSVRPSIAWMIADLDDAG